VMDQIGHSLQILITQVSHLVNIGVSCSKKHKKVA